MATTSRGSRADITLTPDMTDGSTRVLTWLTHSPACVSWVDPTWAPHVGRHGSRGNIYKDDPCR